MRLHIVSPYKSPAMERMVQPLRALPNVTVSDRPEDADINYYVPFHGLADGRPKKGKTVMMYTHMNNQAAGLVKAALKNADAVTCMSWQGVRELEALGWRNKPSAVVYAPLDDFHPSRITVLVVGAEQPNGRKRSSLLMDLAWGMDITPFHFIIVGKGFDVQKLQNAGMSVQEFQNLSQDKLIDLYNSVDMVLCTGFAEGGPLPLAEALACGKRVLSPNFGFAPELLPKEDIYKDVPGLIVRLKELVADYRLRMSRVDIFTSDYYRAVHTNLFADVVDEVATNRYQWVHRLVRESGAKRIMEIGTWRGERALAMISAARETYGEDVTYVGYDLFEEFTPADLKKEFSKIPPSSSVVYNRIKQTGAGLSLYVGDTKKTLVRNRDKNNTFDFIYIDGGHSWETIEHDWEMAKTYGHDKTVYLLDDFYYNEYKEVYGVGCQKLVGELGNEWVVSKLAPVETWPQVWGDLKIGMVKIVHA